MPRLVHSLPKPRLHKPSGQSRLRLCGKEFWLGKHGSPEARAEYDRLIGEWLSNGRRAPAPAPARSDPAAVTLVAPDQVTVTVLIAEFWEWALKHYRHPDGTPTREADNFRSVLRRLRRRFGKQPVADFGPRRLIEFRDVLIRDGLARRSINAAIRRVRQAFRWGVARELVPTETLTRLEAVEPLQPGRGGRETAGTRGPVPWELVEKTLPFLPPLLAAFATALFHSGARRGELARLTTGMIDTSGDVWSADLSRHKTSHHGKRRRLFFGPAAQAALGPWLLPDEPDEPIFSPRRVDDRQARRKGKRLPGKSYSRGSLEQALRRAIARAGVEPWSFGQCRHAAAVRIVDNADLETAKQVLGHSSVAMSQHYAATASARAVDAARRIG